MVEYGGYECGECEDLDDDEADEKRWESLTYIGGGWNYV
jgi:hypothetical protein